MPQRTIRFSETTLKHIRQAAKGKACTSTAIIRQAVEQSLSSSDEAVEQRISATLDQMRTDYLAMHKLMQTLFAYVDALAKAVLTGLPEQSSASVARGKERYDRFVKSASAAILNKPHSTLRDGAES